MGIFYLIYNEIIYKPLLNGLIFLSGIIPFNDIGIAIVILTIIVKLILFPFTHHSVKTQIKIKEIEPELKKIKTSTDDKQKQAEAMLRLYKEHGISPYSGFLLLLIQLPILIALYTLFWKGLGFDSGVYSFIQVPENINLRFLNLFDITKPNVLLAFLTGVTQYLQIMLSMPPKKAEKKDNNDFNAIFAKQMKYFMPAFIFIIALKLPSAVSIYWTTMNIFAIVHESIVRKKAKKITGQ